MAQVAAQAEAEARHLLLTTTDDPPGARRLAVILRTLAEAAGAGAREGRSRLAMELLAVESMTAPASAMKRAAAEAAERPVAERPEPPSETATPAESAADAHASASVAAGKPASVPVSPAELTAIVARWADVVDRAAPAIKPLLRECRPVAIEGVRLTLAFPEERRFMREKASTRSRAIEDLLGDVLTGTWAVECITSNVELAPLSVAQAVAPDPADPDGRALLDGVLRVTGGQLVDVPEVR
ncbi:MAG TPA: hypothetical protein VHK63_03420, partial [Candidatus Limnocylindria bacterium]|nr:hypothetical protein [Candidatus Limnocylindria bacterium]